ncbi:TrlF family AAA-like ATPase [Candidatus Poriferisodalis sp.]|uniref:TrlF family AAA-like ATPase n=1 Tax=Candidatus Poriferisodalis sp. TaxID=3101277 RepID=UPI003B5AD66E
MVADYADSWDFPGAHWWKFDFHTHTPASSDYRDSDVTPADWLLAFMRAGIDCVAVTDHNSGAWVDRLKSVLVELEEQEHPEFRRLHLFPGVEITANGGTHVLALFDPSKASSDVDQLLGAVEYHGEPGDSSRAADCSVVQIVELIVDRGGIAIPAHVDQDRGLWEVVGNTLEPVLTSNDVFAVEIADLSTKRPALYRQHAQHWAEVLGSDSHRLAGSGVQHVPGSHFTWIKMEQPSIDGLRLALLDGERFSVRRSDDPDRPPRSLPAHHVRSIAIAEARLMGHREPATLEFSPWLNVLIGGRGSGKSTVLNCMRLAARREADLQRLDERSNTKSTFDRFNQVARTRDDDGGLRSETRIQWAVSRDGVTHRIHWAQAPDADDTVVETKNDECEWVASTSQHVTADRFPIRLFNQGQIGELAGDNQAALLDLIDEGAGGQDCQRKLEAARRAFFATRARIREVQAELERTGEVEVALEDNARALSLFEEAGHAVALQAFRVAERQEREIERHFAVAEQAIHQVDEVADQLHPEDIAEAIFDEEDLGNGSNRSALAIIGSLRSIVDDAKTALSEASATVREGIAQQREALRQSSWRTSADQTHAAYEQAVAALAAEGLGDTESHAELVQEQQRLSSEQSRLASLGGELAQLRQQASDELAALFQARRALSDARSAFLRETLAQNDYVRIRLIPYGENPRTIERSLRDELGVADDHRFTDDIGNTGTAGSGSGLVDRLIDGLPQDSEPRCDEFETRLESMRQGLSDAVERGEGFGGHFVNFLQRGHSRSADFLDRLLTWFPPDSLHVEHSLTADGTEFRPIGQGSAGQRSAAMLAFLLAYGDEPLVLDQPEDDLDNQLIYSLVVRQMRQNKLRRQIIVVTHNPNIVVNGDAEMLHVLDFVNGQCAVVESGSLQSSQMREQVCRVMEGGRDALTRRYRRLEAGLTDA